VSGEESTREYYRLIRSEAGRLRRLVENLLDFARIEEGRQQYTFEVIDVAAWLQGVVDEFRAIPAASRRPINVTMAAALPAVRADADALARALMNLLDNAVKYSPDGSAVSIEAAAAGASVEIRVGDEGAGITEGDLPHVFERFYRGRDTEGVGGTGLGLALVQRIVQAHGGSVSVKSRVGGGSTFTVRLPAVS
jgi:signal transduction histidine kinase